MSNKEPFFAQFIEKQDLNDQEVEQVSGGGCGGIATRKAPSDNDEDFVTLKFPSDNEDPVGGGPVTLKAPSDNDEPGDPVTLKYPSDSDEAIDR